MSIDDRYVIPLSLAVDEGLSFSLVDGPRWADYFSPATARLGAEINLLIGPDGGGALGVREFRAAGFESRLMRQIPFTRIEAAVNHPRHRAQLFGHVEASASIPMRPRDLAVTLSREYRKPDSFYAEFAELYLWLAALSGSPAHDIAAANDMPVSTVHRWIREAKSRGVLLLPAHRSGGL